MAEVPGSGPATLGTSSQVANRRRNSEYVGNKGAHTFVTRPPPAFPPSLVRRVRIVDQPFTPISGSHEQNSGRQATRDPWYGVDTPGARDGV